MATFAEELYASVAPLAWADEGNDFALQKFCQALGYPFETIQTLVRDTEDGKVGWSILLDPDRVPAEFIPWLEQAAGVAPVRGEPVEDTRDRIKKGEGFKRGTPGLIYARAAQIGLSTFLLQERYTSPWNVRFLFLAEEYTDAKLAELVRLLPAGIKWSYGFWTGMLYSDVEEEFATYAALEAGVADYAALMS